MTLRLKTLLTIGVTVVSLSVVMLLTSRFILLNSYAELEENRAEENVQRALLAITDRQISLRRFASSWSVWDDAYIFIDRRNATFINSINAEASALGDTDLVAFANRDGESIYAFSYHREFDILIPAPNDLQGLLSSDLVLSIARADQPEDDSLRRRGQYRSAAGVVLLDDLPYFIGITPILRSDIVSMPPNGVAVFGQVFDEALIANISETVRLNMQVMPFANSNLDADLRRDLLATGADDSIIVDVIDGKNMAGYALIRDVFGQPLLILRVDLPRDIYQQGQQTIIFFLLALVLGGFVLTLASVIFLDRVLLRRLGTLAAEVQSIGQAGRLSGRVMSGGQDEISSLARNINRMLDSLEEAQRVLIEKDQVLLKQNTELATANQELALARQQAEEVSRLKSSFLASMSHELRTPLNAVIGYSQLMLRGIGGDLTEKHIRNAERIYVNGQHLLMLINDILDISKIEAGRMELVQRPFDLRDMVGEVMSQTQALADEKSLAYSAQIDETLPLMLVADRDRLKQIILNLVSNGIKFTQEGGVSVQVNAASEDGVSAGEQWEIIVKDSGIGIPPHAIEYIFDEFRQVDSSTTREYGGSGLGLAIVNKLVQLMGGSIRIESEVGQGSIFYVRLPLVLPQSSAKPQV